MPIVGAVKLVSGAAEEDDLGVDTPEGAHRPSRPVWCRRTLCQFQRCSFGNQRITPCATRGFLGTQRVFGQLRAGSGPTSRPLIWLSRTRTVLGGCRDNLLVRARNSPGADSDTTNTAGSTASTR